MFSLECVVSQDGNGEGAAPRRRQRAQARAMYTPPFRQAVVQESKVSSLAKEEIDCELSFYRDTHCDERVSHWLEQHRHYHQ